MPLIDGGTIRLPRLIGHGRALDMILTGRAVGASEALAFGLASRVVSKGTARATAEALAADLAKFPQGTMNGDRLSSYDQWSLDLPAALERELAHGAPNLDQAAIGAARFAAGKGRGGTFDDT